MRLADILPQIPGQYKLGKANVETVKKNGFIQLPSRQTPIEIYRIEDQYFFVDLNACYLNEGSFGKVYVVFPINLETGEIDQTKPRALKRIDYDSNDKQQYAKITQEKQDLKRYFKSVSEVGVASRSAASLRSLEPLCYFFTMEYFDGSPLIEVLDGELCFNDDLEALTFRQIISLIREGAAFFQLLHQKTPADPNILIHSDVKPENFLVVFVDGEPRLMPVDFGLAIILSTAELTQLSQCGGSPHTTAPETISGQVGPKSDIFSFLSVIGALFRQVVWRNRFDQENHYWHPDWPFNIESLLDNFTDPNNPSLISEWQHSENGAKWQQLSIDAETQPLLKQLLLDFCNRVGSLEYEQRPDAEAVLFFFSAFEKFLLSYEMEQKLAENHSNADDLKNKRNFYLSQLILHATGLWDKECGIQKNISNPLSAARSRQFAHKQLTTNCYVSELNYAEQPKLCQAIINHYQSNTLTLNTIETENKLKVNKLTNPQLETPTPAPASCIIL